MEHYFQDSFEYKLIYVFEINDKAHSGLVKIGDATLKTDKAIDELPADCHDLNQAALQRIKQYTNTAGIIPKLLHTELAVKTCKNKDGAVIVKAFRDHDIHRVLVNSNIKKKTLAGSTSKEWFEIDLQTALKAIEAVKKNQPNLGNVDMDAFVPIVFRPEQEDAIRKTIKQFKDGNRMLWNAKMRFGKTLSALQVIKECKFEKTIIITHRPVVDAGWFEDFKKIFHGMPDYEYGSKNNGATLGFLASQKKKFVYFASIQDLRGSAQVGGKFEKNDEIFDTEWDFVIVDEAHEGTTTVLGDDVIKNIVKEDTEHDTKFLALSGTPFNILNDYDDNIYTWDYVMEQKNKKDWEVEHFGDSNPYDELPELKIFTYDLGKIIEDKRYVELEDKAFNFREFFRTWTGDVRSDRKEIPQGKAVGDFYHEEDVRSLLNLITKESDDSCYPYANEEYRKLFKHSLWMVPGVREAKALSEMMRHHPIFQTFNVINVAGDGDRDEESKTALEQVHKAIKDAGEDGYTITISCGKLTTGVTVPEWTAVFMLAGSFSTSAANYLQTIFRVQSPCNINGKIKQCCYVFDFAPDRTLKMVAESVALSTKAGKTSEAEKRVLGEFLNFCPVISIDGTEMKSYDTNRLLQQLKRAYAERAVQNGFDDTNLYNDELLKLDELDIEKFNNLKGIVGASKAAPKTKEIDVNNQGFTDEEYEELERIQKKPKRERTPEEEARLKEVAEKNKQKNSAISILRGISIRIPLLIYGADVDIDEDITMDKLVDIVDDSSWEEFMPVGVTKDIFKSFIKYYDAEVFVAAGRKIRNTVKSADELSPTERVKKITELFGCFKNPDKETVLTPWRVVNMHMSDCLGGYDFYDTEHNTLIEVPRFVDKGQVTADTLANKDAKILEINSKTGLYPLYVAYSLYRRKMQDIQQVDLTMELEDSVWKETVGENVFVICKTPMAKQITKRTLIGYSDTSVNAHYFEDLINMMKNKPELFTNKVLKTSYWKKEGLTKMKFDAVVGNPPYQLQYSDGSGCATPLYNHFINQSKTLNSRYLSMIIPARWYTGGKALDEFRNDMIRDKSIIKLFDYGNSQDVFRGVDIAGGVCYFLRDREYEGDCEVINHTREGRYTAKRSLGEFDIFVRDSKAIDIIHKVFGHTDGMMDSVVSARVPFGISTNYKPKEKGIPCWFIQKIGLKCAEEKDITDVNGILNKWKFLAPKTPIAGQTDFTKPVGFYYDGNTRIAKPGECCTDSWVVLNSFETEAEVLSFKSYIFTKIVRFLLLQCVASQDVSRDKFKFVPDLKIYEGTYTDERLCNMWGISEDEWNYIDSRIKNI